MTTACGRHLILRMTDLESGRCRGELNMISSGRLFFAGWLFAVVLGVTGTANAQICLGGE
jgi:hypothetical protein